VSDPQGCGGVDRTNRFRLRLAAALIAVLLGLGPSGADAQKAGGVLRMPDFASPASMSIHEEVTRAAANVLMPAFNNLVLFDQHKAQNSIDTIVPDLAEGWSWDAAKTGFAQPQPRPREPAAPQGPGQGRSR
jgi:ABC-type transport system substrate-binding protein